jgi:hypothetical protein
MTALQLERAVLGARPMLQPREPSTCAARQPLIASHSGAANSVPAAMLTYLRSEMRKTRGRGLPGCGLGVMEPASTLEHTCIHAVPFCSAVPSGSPMQGQGRHAPTSTKPKPMPMMGSITSACLSNPAANPATRACTQQLAGPPWSVHGLQKHTDGVWELPAPDCCSQDGWRRAVLPGQQPQLGSLDAQPMAVLWIQKAQCRPQSANQLKLCGSISLPVEQEGACTCQRTSLHVRKQQAAHEFCSSRGSKACIDAWAYCKCLKHGCCPGQGFTQNLALSCMRCTCKNP